MHPIPVRRLTFDTPTTEDFDPLYAAGIAPVSYDLTGLGLYVALLEPFIVKSMRRVMDRITDERLRDDVDRFCRQEAQHYQQHERFNAIVLAHGYPGLAERIERLAADFRRFLERKSDRFRIGFVEGFEAYTNQGALELLESGVLEHPRTDPRFAHLFRWHMLEEIEHRNVAFDLYEHLYGGHLYRARMCWIAQSHLLGFIRDCARIMSTADVARHGERCRIKRREHALLAMRPWRKRIRSMRPGYTPHDYRVPDMIDAIAARYSDLADSVT